MALHIHKVQPNTTVAEYFIVTDIKTSKFDKSGAVSVSGYASKEARESAPNAPIVKKNFIVSFDDVNENLYAQAYEKLLTAKEAGAPLSLVHTPYFEGATEA